MLIRQEDSATATALKLQEAANQQRRFWRQLRPDDIELIDLQPMVDAAKGIAEVLEKRYRDQSSKAWDRWCQSSLTTGGRAVIRWLKAPERGILKHPATRRQEASSSAVTRNGVIFGVPFHLQLTLNPAREVQNLLSRV